MGESVSESVEMYLVMTALLRKHSDDPVPLSLLASKLSISPASANEMCRKLEERGLVEYQPYKGVTLTKQGEAEAQVVLSRRRLWVVFLVENLGIEPGEADEIACQLEHVTSDRLVNSLKSFLEYGPALARQRRMLPCQPDTEVYRVQSLATLAAGQSGQVVAITADSALTDFLHAHGIGPNAVVEVLAVVSEGSMMLDAAGQRISLSRAVASQVEIVPISQYASSHSQTWEKCSAFWACLKGSRECACNLNLFTN